VATLQLADGVLNYQIDGPADAPVLVMSNSLGTSLGMWDVQIPELSKSFRVVRYDTRGHGESSVTEGPYTIEQLGRDVLALLDELKVERAAFCGLSMGGLIGQWLGINAPKRFTHLVLCNTAAKIGNAEGWNGRIDTVNAGGAKAMADLRDGSIARWFTPEYSAANPAVADRIVSMLANTNPAGYVANCAAVRDGDFREQLGQIEAKTLIICGTGDAVTTPEDGRFMQQRIAGAQQVDFHAAHLSNVEAGDAFTDALISFLKS
jgi:3-oxoadipate enol-lactonase